MNFVEGRNCFYRLRIYDLSKDRLREIETPICGHILWEPSFEMYHQETYYWWADTEEGAEIIQSFDMVEEVFRRILMIESFKENCERYRRMRVLNGSIVLFHYPSRGDEREFDIWGWRRLNLVGFHGQSGRQWGYFWNREVIGVCKFKPMKGR